MSPHTSHVPPTYDDARLILELYDLRREERLRKARAWFVASFKVRTTSELNALCPPGSEQHASYRMVVTYWEMVASLLTSGVLNRELFYQSGRELLVVWERVRHLLPQLREKNHDTMWLHNLESAAADFIAWWERRSPGDAAAFTKRIGG